MEEQQKGRKFTGFSTPIASEFGKYLINGKYYDQVVKALRKLHETGEPQLITIKD